MGLYLYGRLASEGEDSLQTIRRLERRQREEEVHEFVLPLQHSIDEPTVQTVGYPFLTHLKRKVPPHESSQGDQVL